MNRTKIEYLDYTWNPIVGCSGANCAVKAHCWACKQAKRQKHNCAACYSFIPHVHWERLEEPLAVKKPSRIGVAFMGEFYDREISEWIRADIMMQIEKTPEHTFIIFTKQPQNIDLNEPIPSNVWLCVSVNRKQDLWRIDELRKTSAKVKGISFEPLYEDLAEPDLDGIDWAIVGAQTKPHVLPSFLALTSVLDATANFQIPIFMKNNLIPLIQEERLLKHFPRGFGKPLQEMVLT